MAGGVALDMRAYRAHQHHLVLLDEAAPEQVLQHRKLTQAGSSEVQMQTSATNCHAYSVYVGGKFFVVCSNVWRAKLRYMPAGERGWLESNSEYLEVTEPMWEEHPIQAMS